MCDRATKLLLLQGSVFQFHFSRCKGRTKARRTGPYDDYVQLILVRIRKDATNGLHCLAALLYSISDQAHPTEFTCDKDAGHIGLKVGLNLRDIHATPSGSKNQSDRICRTNRLACSMADTIRRPHKMCFFSNHPEYLMGPLFRTSYDAIRTPNALARVDFGMQRRGLNQSLLRCRFQGTKARRFFVRMTTYVPTKDEKDGDRIQQELNNFAHRPSLISRNLTQRSPLTTEFSVTRLTDSNNGKQNTLQHFSE
jgi:hypothetical protein